MAREPETHETGRAVREDHLDCLHRCSRPATRAACRAPAQTSAVCRLDLPATVLERCEELGWWDSPEDVSDRRERHLGIADVLAGEPGSELDRRPGEIFREPKLVADEHVGVQEVGVAAEAIPTRDVLRSPGHAVVAVPARESSQGCRPDRALEMDMELDLRERAEERLHRRARRVRAVCARRRRPPAHGAVRAGSRWIRRGVVCEPVQKLLDGRQDAGRGRVQTTRPPEFGDRRSAGAVGEQDEGARAHRLDDSRGVAEVLLRATGMLERAERVGRRAVSDEHGGNGGQLDRLGTEHEPRGRRRSGRACGGRSPRRRWLRHPRAGEGAVNAAHRRGEPRSSRGRLRVGRRPLAYAEEGPRGSEPARRRAAIASAASSRRRTVAPGASRPPHANRRRGEPTPVSRPPRVVEGWTTRLGSGRRIPVRRPASKASRVEAPEELAGSLRPRVR